MSDMPDHHGVFKAENESKYPNSTIELLHERASCRAFQDKAVDEKTMKYILDAGVHAPTGGNLQPYSIIKIENKETNAQLANMCGQSFIGTAPVNLLFCIDFHRNGRWARLSGAPHADGNSLLNFWITFQDTIIAAQNICTAADAMGLGSVYIGTISSFFDKIAEMFELPKGVFPVVLLTMGYPRMENKPRKKLPSDLVVHNEKYTQIPDDELLRHFDEKYPGVKIDITPERVHQVVEVARQLHGNDYAEAAREKIEKDGYINMAQRYFGLHYVANNMIVMNEKILEDFEKLGIYAFKKYIPGNTVNVNEEVIKNYVGRYRHPEDDEIVELKLENGKLIFIEDDFRTELYAYDEKTFFLFIGDTLIKFKDSDKKAEYMTLTARTASWKYKRI